MSETTWALLKAIWPLLFVIAFLNLLGWLQRKLGKPRPAASHCGVCHTPSPGLRAPATLKEAMWGGWTCAGCGATVNAQGEPIPGAPPRPPSRPLNGPISGLFRRRPGVVMGLFWGLCMWLAMSVAPEVLTAWRGETFSVGKVLVGLLIWGGAGGLLFGSAMRLTIFRKPKA
jgi:hypothetical protein